MEINNINYKHWNENIIKFLNNLNLKNTAQVFSTELVVLPENTQLIENSIKELVNGFLITEDYEKESTDINNSNNEQLSPIQKQNNSNDIQISATQNEIDERIDKFILVKRAKIDQSNQEEFIDLSKNNPENNENSEPCSRTNPNKINRNIQMKIDVINNYQREISLLRSVGIGKASVVEKGSSSSTAGSKDKNQLLSSPGILERLSNLEAHLNLNTETNPNKELNALERIQVIELKMLQLERTLPTWCGLNLCQPNREFPPPPTPSYVFKNRNGDIIISPRNNSN